MHKGKALRELAESDKSFFGKIDFLKQSAPQKVFSSVWELDSEVNAGGFWQYFVNSSVASLTFVEEALTKIGAAKTADICERAINIAFPHGLPETAEESKVTLDEREEELREELDELDQEFFAYPDDLTALLYEFVVQHPEAFGEVAGPGH